MKKKVILLSTLFILGLVSCSSGGKVISSSKEELSSSIESSSESSSSQESESSSKEESSFTQSEFSTESEIISESEEPSESEIISESITPSESESRITESQTFSSSEVPSTIEIRDVNLYEKMENPFKLQGYFVNNVESPYFSIDSLLAHRASEPFTGGFPLPDLKLEFKDGVEKAINTYKDKEYAITYNSIENTVSFTDYAKAADIYEYGVPRDCLGADRSPITISTSDALPDIEEEKIYDLDEYGIELVSYNNHILVPLFLLNALYFDVGEKCFLFNGKDLYPYDVASKPLTTGNKATDLVMNCFRIDRISGSTVTYEDGFTPNTPINEETALFNRGGILLTLDMFFGRKDQVEFSSFTEFAKTLGIYVDLASKTPITAASALAFLIESIDDLHSNIVASGPLAGSINYNRDAYNAISQAAELARGDRSKNYSNMYRNNYYDKRDMLGTEAINDGYYFYEDTCYIRFNGFNRSPNDDVFGEGTIKHGYVDRQNTFNIFYNAFEEIKNRSNIKNIVIDETINGGGDFTTLVEIAGFFMNEVKVLFKNKIDDRVYEAKYKVDTNLDGVFDEKDCPGTKYNVFLAASESSFSCGNALPSVFKNNKVGTLIGRQTYGGSCVVMFANSPVGDCYRFSGSQELCLYDKDGNVISNDCGVTPDYTLSNSQLFNKEYMETFLNSH